MAWNDLDYVYAKWCKKCNQTCEINMQYHNNCGFCGKQYPNDNSEFVVLCNKCSTRNRNGERNCKNCYQSLTTGNGGWTSE
jgi:hypothetical protein